MHVSRSCSLMTHTKSPSPPCPSKKCPSSPPPLTPHAEAPPCWDAIGRTVKETDRRITALPDAEKPGKVVLTIFTDGRENASREYTATHISDLIRLYRDQKGWEFLFLAANQDAIATAAAMNMNTHSSANVKYSMAGVKSTGSAMSRKVRAMRMKSSGTMDAQALEDDAKSMNEIVKEEEQK